MDDVYEIEQFMQNQPGADSTARGIMIGMTMFLIFVSIVCWILQIIANWKLFTKMGEPGWKSIIPFLNTYTFYKKIWKGFYGILGILLPFFGGMMFGIAASITRSGVAQEVRADFSHMNTVTVVLVIIGCILTMLALVIGMIGLIKLANAFGKGAGFAVGLIFFTLIFTLVLAFGSDEYQGNPNDPGAQGSANITGNYDDPSKN